MLYSWYVNIYNYNNYYSEYIAGHGNKIIMVILNTTIIIWLYKCT